MTKFSDQLFADLMREHSATLQATKLPAAARGHRAVKRGAALAGGGGALAVGITAALAATSGGGGAAAYAVTPHADGTVTVGISQLSGIAGANSSLSALGDRVVVVPVKAGCESVNALPAPATPRGRITVSASVGSFNGSITVDAHGVPQGDVLVLAVDDTGHGTVTAARLTVAPAPSCVSLPAGATAPVGPPAGVRSGGARGSISISGSSAAQPGTKGSPERGSRQVTSSSGPGTSTPAG